MVVGSTGDFMKTVTIIIPCRNEEKYIGGCLDSLLANDYPKEYMEILVIDGMSQDKTRQLVVNYIDKYPFIKLVDNPEYIKPTALNIGITMAESDVIMRIDAHAVYAADYVSKLVDGLFRYDADNIGGVRETHPGDTPMENAIAIGVSHPFLVGNAYWRTGLDKLRQVDTVYCGCYKKEVFEKIGLFDKRFIRAQDREFNARLIGLGGKIFCDPSVKCTYFARKDLWGYLKWLYVGAKWLFYGTSLTKIKLLSWRNYIPIMFILYQLLLLVMLGAAPALGYLMCIPLLFYLGLAVLVSGQVALGKHDWKLLVPFLVVSVSTHYTYALGSLNGVVLAMMEKIRGRGENG